MNINYYLKDNKKIITSVNIIIRYKGKRFKLATGESIEVKFWNGRRLDEKKDCPDAPFINLRLERIESRIRAVFEPHILVGTIPDLNDLRAAISEPEKSNRATEPSNYLLPFFKKYYNDATYKLSTWKKYNTAYNWLEAFEKNTRQRITFENINMNFYNQFRFFVLTKTYTPSKDEAPRNYTVNYFGSLIKCLKKVMNEAGEHGAKLHQNTAWKSSKFKTEAETADSIYLSVSELMKIHNFTATTENIKPVTADQRLQNLERKAAALNLAKNKFIIGAFTALRVSDFNRLDEVNIKQNWIRIKPRKGTRKNNDVIIPIHPVVREIMAGGFDLAALVSEQKINRHIKEVCKLVGITESVTTARTEGGTITERTRPKYELVTTHTARRSGATNMYMAGVPAISIMKITGHTTEKSFMKYIKITAEENATLLQTHPFFNSDILHRS